MSISKFEEKLHSWWIIGLSHTKRRILLLVFCLLLSLTHDYIDSLLTNHPLCKITFYFLELLIFAILWTRTAQDRQKLKEISTRDNLVTSIHNRRYMEDSLQRLQKQLLRDIKNGRRSYLVLVFMDMDDLKKINDRYGHAFGDSAICTTAEIIRQEIREDVENYLCRYGGDEFCAAIKINDVETEIEALNEVSIICNRIRDNLNKAVFYYKNKRISLSLTMGMHTLKPDSNVMESLAEADRQMNEKKKELKVGRYK